MGEKNQPNNNKTEAHNSNQQHQNQGKIKNQLYLTKKFKCLTLLFSTAFQVPLAMAE